MSRWSSAILPALPAVLLSGLIAVPAQAVPAPPALRTDRFGIYHWAADDTAAPCPLGAPPSCQPKLLRWGADKVAEIGSRTIRVYLGPSDSYGANPKTNPKDDLYLRRIAASPEYDALFRDPRFRTYLLTVYTYAPVEQGGGWQDGFSSTEYRDSKTQILRLGEYLLTRAAYAGKTFILLNWEGDNALRPAPGPTPAPPATATEGFTRWIQSRADGVRLARSRRPNSSAQLYSGLEFNLVERDGVRCGDGQVRCVIDSVAPRVTVDYYSYSSWQTLNVKLDEPPGSLKEKFDSDLRFALAKVRSRRPDVEEKSFLLGEFGFARSQFGECLAADYLREVAEALDAPGAFRLSYAIFWQLLDNRWRTGKRTPCAGEGSVDWLFYGLFRGRDAGMTVLGKVLRDLLRGQPATVPQKCPRIVAPEGEPLFQAGGPLTLSGDNFGPQGNHVLILRGHDRRSIRPPIANVIHDLEKSASDPLWFESPQQIKATLPANDPRDGCALVWVSRDDKIESNALLVRIRPAPPGH